MNKNIKQKWLTALRSGKYTQGLAQLRSVTNNFCCLGVLCDVIKDEFVLEWKRTQEGYFIMSEEDSQSANLPINLREKYGIEMSMSDENVLTEMNDNGESFSQIADWIEESY